MGSPIRFTDAATPITISMPSKTTTHTGQGPLFQIVYVSSAVRPFSTDELIKLLDKARPRNLAAGVTGMLLYHDGNFIQLLEGPEESVRKTHERIRKDPRHTGLITLVHKQAQERYFSDWSMGFKKVSLNEAKQIPGFTDFLFHTERGQAESAPNATLRLLHSFRERLR
jgi:hypothetical protein